MFWVIICISLWQALKFLMVIMISGVKAKLRKVLAKKKLIFWFFKNIMVVYAIMF